MAWRTGKHPKEIFDTYTVDQASILYDSILERDADMAEITAKMVWAIADGWKRPKKSKDMKDDLKDFKATGMVQEI